jgi:hypothetical protein
MAHLRLPAAALTVAAAALLMTGCSKTSAPVDGSTVAGPETSSSSGPTSGGTDANGAVKLTGGPLLARDLPGFNATTMPSDTDLLRACGQGTGVTKLQTGAKAQALTGPGGVQVVSRVATYKAGKAPEALGAVDALLSNCPADDTDTTQTTFTQLSGPAGQPAVGVLATTQTEAGAGEAAGYWIVQFENATVEVYARGTFGLDAGFDVMTNFADALRDAAIAKATGQPVPAVSVPTADAGSGAGGSSPSAPDLGSGAGGESGPGESIGREAPGESINPMG